MPPACSTGWPASRRRAPTCWSSRARWGSSTASPAAPGRSGAAADLARRYGVPVLLMLDVSGQSQTAAAIARGFATHDPEVRDRRRDPEPGGERAARAAGARRDRGARRCRWSAPCTATRTWRCPSATSGWCRRASTRRSRPSSSGWPTSWPRALDLDAVLALAAPLGARAGADAGAAAAARPARRGRRGRGLQLRLSAPRPALARGGAPSSCPSRRSPTRGPTRPATPAGCPAAIRSCTPAGSPRPAASRQALRRFAADRPVHGECGGFMVLGRALEDADGVTHPMAGLLGHVTSYARRQDEPRLPPGAAARRLRRSAGPARRCAGTSSTTRGWSSPGTTRRSPSSSTARGNPLGPVRARGAATSPAPSSTPSPSSRRRMLEIVVIGIGTGNPEHMTVEAIGALNAADLVLIPRKGAGQGRPRRAPPRDLRPLPRPTPPPGSSSSTCRRRDAAARLPRAASRPGTARSPAIYRRLLDGAAGHASRCWSGATRRSTTARCASSTTSRPAGSRSPGGWCRGSPACRCSPPATAIALNTHRRAGARHHRPAAARGGAGGRLDRGDARRRLRLPRRCRRGLRHLLGRLSRHGERDRHLRAARRGRRPDRRGAARRRAPSTAGSWTSTCSAGAERAPARRAHSASGPGSPRRSQRARPGEDPRPDPRPRQPLAAPRRRRRCRRAGTARSRRRAASRPPRRAGRAGRRRRASRARVASAQARVGQRQPPGLERRAADRPGAGGVGEARDLGRRAEGEAEPQPGEAEELAERAQRDDARAAESRADRERRVDVGEALVDDEQPDRVGERQQRLRRPAAAVGIVGVDDDGRVEAAQRVELARPRSPTSRRRRRRRRARCRSGRARAARPGGRSAGHQPDRRLGAGERQAGRPPRARRRPRAPPRRRRRCPRRRAGARSARSEAAAAGRAGG